MKIISNFVIELDSNKIIQLLGSKPSKPSKSKQEILKRIEELKKTAYELIKPVAIYDLFSSKDLTPRTIFEKSEKTILAICTISNKLEKEVSKRIKKTDLVNGVILDAIASEATEEVTAKANQIILEENHDLQQYKHTARFSPGYCRWQLSDGQKLIFTLLPAKQINVKLSTGMMMIPRKSTSFAINFGYEIEKGLGERDCNACEITACKDRR